MKIRNFALLLAFLFPLMSSMPVWAQDAAEAEATENEGQSDLDQAVEIKISAENFNDLGKVIVLCESAMLRGLDEDNTEFAKQLLASTRLDRASKICQAIFDVSPPNRNWVELREIAVVDLRGALKHNADVAEAHFLLGRLYSLPGGNAQQANARLTKAIELAGENLVMKARAFAVRGEIGNDIDRRMTDLTTAIELVPVIVDPYRARALLHAAKGDIDKAIEDFDKAIELEPDHARTYQARGVFLLSQEKFDAAKASLDKALELDDTIVTAYANRARVQSLLGDHDAAIADITRAIESAPETLGYLLLRAQLQHRAEKTDKALEDIKLVLAQDANNASAIQLRAGLLAATGKFEEALADLNWLLERAPKNPLLLIEVAYLNSAMKNHDKAMELYNKAVELDGENWAVYRGRGDVFLALNEPQKAIDDYEKALDLNADSSGVLNNLAWLLSTAPEAEFRDGPRAIELANKACELTEFKKAHIISTLAAGYAETGDFATAIDWIKKALPIARDENIEHLSNELESYEAEQPWRERQGADGPERVLPGEESEGEKEEEQEPAEDEAEPGDEG